jgi:uncharacterized protein YjbJ (UPF0337 family)
MNGDQFAGKWRQIRGQIRAKWGQLTDDDLDKVQGNYDMLVGRIQELYGRTREEIEREIEALKIDERVRDRV